MKQMLPKVTKNNKGRIFSEFRLNKLNKSGFQIQQNYGSRKLTAITQVERGEMSLIGYSRNLALLQKNKK